MSKILDDNTDIRKLQTGSPNGEIDPYELLRNAIIITAVKDYRKCLKKLKKCCDNAEAIKMKIDCEKFFLSDYYYELTDVDGQRMIDLLKKECDFCD